MHTLKNIPIWCLIFWLAFAGMATAQDSVQYATGFEFNKGIYLTFQDFRANKPIPIQRIKTIENQKGRLDYLSQIAERKSFDYLNEQGTVVTVKTSTIWGYSSGRNLYLYPDIRVSIIGAICHTNFTQVENQPTGVDMYGNPGMMTPVTTVVQYILDFHTGEFVPFSKPNLEAIFKRDPDLFKEYKKFKGSRKQKLYLFMNRYNKRNPISFPAQ